MIIPISPVSIRRVMDLPPLPTTPTFGMWTGMATVREEKSRLAFILFCMRSSYMYQCQLNVVDKASVSS